MADERDFELLDDYLTNRMNEGERSAFEQKLQADPDLQHEYALQQRLIKGIRDARVAELKSMLNNVPVPSNNPGNSLLTKIMLGGVASIIIAAGGYWYYSSQDDQVAAPEAIILKQERKAEEVVAPDSEVKVDAGQQEQKQQQPAVVTPRAEADKNQTSAGTEHSRPSLAKKPDPLQAPGEKQGVQHAAGGTVEDSNTDINTPGSLAGPVKSGLTVETQADDTQNPFRYQFKDGKLLLYGPFEQHHDIMEYSADGERVVVLYHKEQYYVLEDADSNVRQLEAVTDPALLKKFKEDRNSK